MTINFPTLILVLISFTTNYFGHEEFKAAVGVNLTCLLVNVTLFTSVSAKLPESSYFKIIDLWLLFTMAIPFIEVVLHTIQHHYKLEEETYAFATAEKLVSLSNHEQLS